MRRVILFVGLFLVVSLLISSCDFLGEGSEDSQLSGFSNKFCSGLIKCEREGFEPKMEECGVVNGYCSARCDPGYTRTEGSCFRPSSAVENPQFSIGRRLILCRGYFSCVDDSGSVVIPCQDPSGFGPCRDCPVGMEVYGDYSCSSTPSSAVENP